jgi:arylsulfatase A-like enzyme
MSDEHNPQVAGCYGSRIVHTPRLDQIAEHGITFDGCYTNSPLCVPSRLSFTSGKYASRVNAWNNSCRLPTNDFPSIPHVMNKAGYESFLCGKMHYDNEHRYGFTEIGGNMNNSFMTGRGYRRAADDLGKPTQLSERFAEFHAGDDSPIMRHDRAVTAGVLDFLSKRNRGDKPFYLQAGRVLDALRTRGLSDNTVVIYTADHGENMGEHGLWWKNCVFEYAARVPLIVSWPKRFRSGQRRQGACALVDVVQTIAER